jgi:hypothetical protein
MRVKRQVDERHPVPERIHMRDVISQAIVCYSTTCCVCQIEEGDRAETDIQPGACRGQGDSTLLSRPNDSTICRVYKNSNIRSARADPHSYLSHTPKPRIDHVIPNQRA